VSHVSPTAFPAASFLGGLGAADLEALRAASRVRRYRSGELVLHEGDASRAVLAILTGTVKLTKTATSGREAVLELRGAGEVVGELGAIDGQTRSASAVALGEVEALVVPADVFNALLRERGGLAHQLLVTEVARLREAAGRQLELGTADVVGRVCRRLAELAASHGVPMDGGVLVRGAISQQDLADWSGISRDGVVRALGELRRLGWLDTGRQRVLIRDLDAITRRAAG
jgi:CRP/FNR family transcriptional regulator, cyclic AMP receptor protein